jgi:hypothetical protein
LAYYKLDTLVGGVMVDSIGSSNLIDDGPNSLTLAAGKIGNGISPSGVFVGTALCHSWHIAELTSTSQTYRFWFKESNNGDYVTVASPFCNIAVRTIPAHSQVVILITGNQNPSGQVYVVTFGTLNTAIFHYALFSIDYPNKIATLSIDNVVVDTRAITLAFPYLVSAPDPPNIGQQDFGILFNTADFTNYVCDEVSVWSRLLTGSELTADWNAGAGRTFPFPP